MILGGNGGDVNIGNNQTNFGGSGPQNVYNVRENNGGIVLPMLFIIFPLVMSRFKVKI